MEARLLSAVFLIRRQQGLIEEDLLSFCLADTMFIGALAGVTLVPVKTGNLRPVNHGMYIINIYTIRQER